MDIEKMEKKANKKDWEKLNNFGQNYAIKQYKKFKLLSHPLFFVGLFLPPIIGLIWAIPLIKHLDNKKAKK